MQQSAVKVKNLTTKRRSELLRIHVEELLQCNLCPAMHQPVVSGRPNLSEILLVGQAPGPKEGDFGKPFAWTAGKTLFRWFAEIGLDEESFRSKIYMAAVCRCFPGKNPKGGDRVPDQGEIERCSQWLQREIELLKPRLVIPVGKLAIRQFLTPLAAAGSRRTPEMRLDTIIGTAHRIMKYGHEMDAIPLPHPSGASTWHRTEPGKTLLRAALALIKEHPAYEGLSKN